MTIAYPLCGFVVGALVGITGMGGGSVMTALLIVLFGIHPVTAVGTDLLYAAVTKSAGARVHAGKGNVVWPLVGWMALGSVPGTLLAISVLSRLPLRNAVLERGITLVIGAALLAASLDLLLRGSRSRLSQLSTPDQEVAEARPSHDRQRCLTVLLGFVLGIVVALTSVGAGAVGIVVLRRLHPNIPSVRLVGTDITHAVPLTLLAGSGHWLIGDIDWVLLGLLLVGSIPGIMITSHYAHHVPETILRPVLGVVLLFIAVPLVLR